MSFVYRRTPSFHITIYELNLNKSLWKAKNICHLLHINIQEARLTWIIKKKLTTHYSWKVCKYQGVIRSCKSKRNKIKWSFLYSTRMLSHDDHWVSLQFQCRWVYRLIVFNTTFNNILAISWCRKSEYFKLHQNGFQLWRTLTPWKVLENKYID